VTRFGVPPCMAVLPDGCRRHLQHGPIDIILEAFGPAAERTRAYDQAWRRFHTILEELTAELSLLRRPLDGADSALKGPVARRMCEVCRPHASVFVTPMAAVAGAVADETLAVMTGAATLQRAYVNNGGDIALYLTEARRFDLMVARLDGAGEHGRVTIAAADPVRGVATSGRGGRSHSLGIADSVTVLARTAAEADAAATLISNAVDLPGHPAIERVPAEELDPDTLVERAVRANIHTSVNALRQGSEILETLIREDELKVVGAEYSLATGVVEFLEDI